MASQQEFTALLNDSPGNRGHGGARVGHHGGRPPPTQQPREKTPLLGKSTTEPLNSGHGRSRSEMVFPSGRAADPNHPLLKAPGAGAGNRSRPPLHAPGLPPPPPASILSPLSFTSPTGESRKVPHRRAASDIPLNVFASDSSSVGSKRITKADLLRNYIPNPRWSKSNSMRKLPSFGTLDDSIRSGISSTGRDDGYGSMSGGVIGDVNTLHSDLPKPRHVRSKSTDVSVTSVTSKMIKSSLFKGVTSEGRIQLQLPKDSFRILMDNELEPGFVYKRKLVDDEDGFFVEFHTVDDNPNGIDEEKRLPPDLYVMAVDSTLYRRMLDEVIAADSMPCGTFYCGHHEDVRHPGRFTFFSWRRPSYVSSSHPSLQTSRSPQLLLVQFFFFS